MDIFADVNGGIQCEVTAKIVTARRKYIAIRCTAIDSYALSTPRLAAHRQLTVYLFQFRGKSDFLLGLVVADGGMRLAAEAVRVRLGGRVLLCQHQLLVSLVVPDLVLVVVDEKFAAVILFRAGGNDAVHAARALGHADACARVQFAADGDGIAASQIHIADIIFPTTFPCVPRDGRLTGHGEGAAVHKHAVGGVAGDAGVAVHVELADD